MSGKYIGVDIGGTKIYIGLVDVKTGELLDYVHFFKENKSSSETLEQINFYILSLFQKYGQEYSVGIAVPELVNKKGKISSNFTYDWVNQEKDFIGKNTVFESDVRAAALAETKFGAAKNALSAIYISLGTGLSYSFIQGGQIWKGHKGHAIHFATSDLYFPLSENLLIQKPQAFNYEKNIGGKGLNKIVKSTWGMQENTKNWLENQKDPQKKEAIQNYILYLGGLVGQLVNILDPEKIVIGGGLGMALQQPAYEEMLKNIIRKHIIATESKDIQISWAQYGGFSALIGAALTASFSSLLSKS